MFCAMTSDTSVHGLQRFFCTIADLHDLFDAL